jgi:hypothetical protein
MKRIRKLLAPEFPQCEGEGYLETPGAVIARIAPEKLSAWGLWSGPRRAAGGFSTAVRRPHRRHLHGILRVLIDCGDAFLLAASESSRRTTLPGP